MTDDTRGRGILTERDREWLRNQTDGSTDSSSYQVDSNRRQAISHRVTNALEDFELLVEELPDRLLRDVVTDLKRGGSFYSALAPMVAFCYQLANEEEHLADGIRLGHQAGAHRFRTFELALNNGIEQARDHTDWFRDPSDDPAVSPAGELYETPPLEMIRLPEIENQWKTYGNLIDPVTNESVYKSNGYGPTSAKGMALANVKANVEQLQQQDRQSRPQWPSKAEHLIADREYGNSSIEAEEYQGLHVEKDDDKNEDEHENE